MDLFYTLSDLVCNAVFRLLNVGSLPLMRLRSSKDTPCKVLDGSSSRASSLHVTGLGVEWPSKSYGPETFEEWVREHYDITKPGILKLLEVNKRTGINTRGLVAPFGQVLWEDRAKVPNIEQTDAFYRKHATQLAVRACNSAIKEWGGRVNDITHTIAVTCTNAGSPGFDQAVAAQLGLPLDVDKTLLHGVGCAGGLAALRTAAQLARGSDGRPTNILVFACELPSSQVSVELEEAEHNPHPPVGPVLFSDGASALVLCNGIALSSSRAASLYELLGWTTMRIPETDNLMAYPVTPLGFKLSLSREVPVKAASAIRPAFNRLLWMVSNNGKCQKAQDFDWALHPGGLSVIKGAEVAMDLTEDHLRASYDVYRNHGNTSSVAVLAVLSRLRDMSYGRENIIACSFGPGLTVEMALLRRSHHDGS